MQFIPLEITYNQKGERLVVDNLVTEKLWKRQKGIVFKGKLHHFLIKNISTLKWVLFLYLYSLNLWNTFGKTLILLVFMQYIK